MGSIRNAYTDRIAELEAELATVKAELESLKGGSEKKDDDGDDKEEKTSKKSKLF